jgi:O-antigen ligase
MKPEKHFKARHEPKGFVSAPEVFALVFGIFLGLALIKFGNPVILDAKIPPPASWLELRRDPWPPHWAFGPLVILALAGVFLAFISRPRWPELKWLWILPLVWFGWQCVSAIQTVDAELTRLTLWQFGGCLVCYFAGALLWQAKRSVNFLFIGLLVAFIFCLVRAVDQKLFEFPRERQSLVEGEQSGWTNFPSAVFQDMKRVSAIISTNGVEVANPVFLDKYKKGRAYGTLVYPNALAGAVLLIFPAAILLIWNGTRRLRGLIRAMAMGLILFLGGASLVSSGSKSGWLIAILLGFLCLWRMPWPAGLRRAVLLALVVIGLAGFGVRFHSYFQKGATSVVARFDYWRAAGQITAQHPVMGSGPGTFQRPYADLKSPKAEMARLVHNDYLQQFSDSGLIGGISYLGWIVLWIWVAGRNALKTNDLRFAIFLGVFGWLVQGITEFGLYVPALAWTAFALMGWLIQNDSTKAGSPDNLFAR